LGGEKRGERANINKGVSLAKFIRVGVKDQVEPLTEGVVQQLGREVVAWMWFGKGLKEFLGARGAKMAK